MTMTGARRIFSLMLSSLFARWRSLSPANDKTAYERKLDRLLNACEDEVPSARQQVGMLRKSASWV